MSNHMSGNRDSVATDDGLGELAQEMGHGSELSASASEAQGAGYEFDLEAELMRELGAAPELDAATALEAGPDGAPETHRQMLDEDAPPLAADVSDLPNMHLGAGRATRWSEQDFGLDSGFDAAAEDLESEFNALIGNASATPAMAVSEDGHFDAGPAPETAEVNRVELVESPMSADSSKFAAADSKVATENPFEMLAAMASRYSQDPSFDTGYAEQAQADRYEPSFEPAYEPAPRAAAPRSQATPRARVDAPSIDTVEINDRMYYQQETLDIPTAYHDEPVQTQRASRDVNDDIDDEFFDLLNQMSGQGGQPQAAAAHEDFYADNHFAGDHAQQQTIYSRATPHAATAQELAAKEASRQASHAAYHDDSFSVRPTHQASDDDFDLGQNFEDEIGFAAYEPAEQESGPKRKFWGAAIIGGLAVAVAVGAYAMNMVGGGISGAPVLVQADNSPIKVRPANPGGATIPNQNSGVYDAVSGVNTASTSQKKLVDGAETPIEMVENLPENSDDLVAEGEDAKSEDRIEQTAQTEQPTEAQPTKSSVQPKVVRTVTVKPDGSISKPAPAKAAAKAPVKQAAAAEADESVEDVVADADKPAGVAKEQTTASIPAASGAWATQIASEGSEAAAKAAYKKLSAKYPSIGGKGVAIVKAEVSGATRYRVRIMSESKADAQSLCSGIKSKGGSCFVSKS